MPDNENNPTPRAEGLRQRWEDIPDRVRAKIEAWLGSPVVKTDSRAPGFSPGVASRLTTDSGHTVFLKAAGSDINPATPNMHRNEAKMMQLLPLAPFAPDLLWFLDDDESGWVVLIFENIHGHNPTEPWRLDDLHRVMTVLTAMSNTLKADMLPEGMVPDAGTLFSKGVHGWQKLRDTPELGVHLDAWTTQHLAKLCTLETSAPDAVAGRTLLHFDIRADNILLSDEKVWIIDWPQVCTGAAWLDVVLFAPSVDMQGGLKPEELIQLHPPCQEAAADDITAAIASLAGFFTYRALLPPAPGLSTLPQFLDAQGRAARRWIRERTGWA